MINLVTSRMSGIFGCAWKSTPCRRALLLLTGLFWTGLAGLVEGSVVINEFVSSNGDLLADEDGDFVEWIELYNRGDTAVDLAGYGLSDDPGNRFLWTFPQVVIGPGEFLLVWASGKNRAEAGEPLHTAFQISSDGEPLILSGPANGPTLDTSEPVALPRNHSYGRVPDGTGEWVYFAEPTPLGSNNTTTFDAWLAAPRFSTTGGFHTSTVMLELSTDDPGATILYTLDGTEPRLEDVGGRTYRYQAFQSTTPREATLESRIYETPLTLASRAGQPNWLSTIRSTWDSFSPPSSSYFKGHVVRSRVVREGSLPSEVITHSYFITSQGDQRYAFPVLSLTVPEDRFFSYDYGIYVPGIIHDEQQQGEAVWRRPANYHQRGDEWEVPGHLGMFVQGEGLTLSQNVGFRVHGNASRSYFMKSLRVYSRRDYDREGRLNHRFFEDLHDIYGRPLNNFNRMIIRSSGNDNPNSRFRDLVMQTILRPIGLDDQRFLPVVHFINGEFWGHMNLRERIDEFYVEGRHLIDPDDVVMLTKGHDKGIYQGVMLKSGTEEDLQEYKDFIAFVEGNDLSDPEHFATVADRVDLDNFMLYCVAEIYVGNRDWPHNNYDFWRKREADRRPGAPKSHDGRWRWALVDLDMGLGLYGNPPTHDTLGWATRSVSWGEDPARVGATRLLRGLIQNPDFRDRFANAFADHLNTTFQPDRVVDLIDEFNALIGPLRDGEHKSRWPSMGSNQVANMKQFAQQRPAYLWNRVAQFFQIGSPATVTFNVSDPDHGALQINTLLVDHGSAGLSDPDHPFPFNARYFRGHPVEVTALPRPGYRFAGWEEFPDHTGATIAIEPKPFQALTALFEPGPEDFLLAYWNFNDIENLLEPSFSLLTSGISVDRDPGSEVTDGGGNGFAGANARWQDEAGRHLRLNNPLGTTIALHLPTTGYSDPVLTYETRRSNQGAGRQLVSTSIDGTHYEEFAEIIVFPEDPIIHRFDFSVLEGAADNPDFHVRISFLRGEGGFFGNNRIDNLALEGREIWTGSFFEGSGATWNLGAGWRWNPLGYFYDPHFPFVYSTTFGGWIYIMGDQETDFYFWDYTGERWIWTSSLYYPWYYVVSGSAAGQWLKVGS